MNLIAIMETRFRACLIGLGGSLNPNPPKDGLGDSP